MLVCSADDNSLLARLAVYYVVLITLYLKNNNFFTLVLVCSADNSYSSDLLISFVVVHSVDNPLLV